MRSKDLYIDVEDFFDISEEILGKGKQFSFRARGTSMSPFIREGDTVIISPLSGPISIGDIINKK